MTENPSDNEVITDATASAYQDLKVAVGRLLDAHAEAGEGSAWTSAIAAVRNVARSRRASIIEYGLWELNKQARQQDNIAATVSHPAPEDSLLDERVVREFMERA